MRVNLILEGALEEPVGRKVVAQCGHTVGEIIRLSGASAIKARAFMYHPMTKRGEAILVLTDSMDTGEPCIPQAKINYLEKHIPQPSPNFLLRFAVRELESWLLADRHGIASFLRIPPSKVATNPETLEDPKRELIRLARRSRSSSIREGIVPDSRHGGVVAPGYIGTMTHFIEANWDIEEAQNNSESLRRCMLALSNL